MNSDPTQFDVAPRAESAGVHSHSVVMLAGWLFADLALALVFVLIATTTDTRAVAQPKSTPTASQTPAPSPAPSVRPPLGVEKSPVNVVVHANAAALIGKSINETRGFDSVLRARLAPLARGGRRVAFVLTFGASSDIDQGVKLAAAANERLRIAAPSMFSAAATRPFWQGLGAPGVRTGTVSFELYLFIGG